MSNVDLHMHSSFSDDGQYTVLELTKLAEQAGLVCAAISDHDSVKSAIEIEQYQPFTPVKWIKGVELSVRYQDTDLHLLAYEFDPNFLWFEKHCTLIKQGEADATDVRIERINQHFNIQLTRKQLEKLAKGHLITGEIMAEAILEDPKNQDHPILKEYFPKGKRSGSPLVNFYWDFLSQGKVAYVPTPLSTFREAVEAIHQAGGLAVLAHPGQTIHENVSILNDMVHLGLDGIECYSSYHSDIQNAFYVGYAAKRHLMITCGSDFHGKTKPKIKLGQTNSPLSAEDVLKQFEERGKRV